VDYIDNQLVAQYRSAGFDVFERGTLPADQWPEFNTSWTKRLQRSITYLIARAI